MNLSSLHTSISHLSQEAALSLILKVRESRLTSKRVVKEAKKKASISTKGTFTAKEQNAAIDALDMLEAMLLKGGKQ